MIYPIRSEKNLNKVLLINITQMKKNIFILSICFILFNFTPKIDAREEDKIEYIKEGNIALPTSQQPGPLFSFGQNIVDKNDFQIFSFIEHLKGKNKQFDEVTPISLYGITDNVSLYIGLPIAIKLKQNNFSSSGIEDLIVELEYAFYNKETIRYQNQATLVANIGFPTGSDIKNPHTGYGSPSFFLGLTASHMAIEWYTFLSAGVTIPTPHKNTHFGNQFYYQFGFGKNIAYKSEKWILTWMIEFNGTDNRLNQIRNPLNPNLGGNTFTIGPSLWFSTQKLIIQAGIAIPLVHNPLGNQNINDYFVAVDIGVKF